MTKHRDRLLHLLLLPVILGQNLYLIPFCWNNRTQGLGPLSRKRLIIFQIFTTLLLSSEILQGGIFSYNLLTNPLLTWAQILIGILTLSAICVGLFSSFLILSQHNEIILLLNQYIQLCSHNQLQTDGTSKSLALGFVCFITVAVLITCSIPLLVFISSKKYPNLYHDFLQLSLWRKIGIVVLITIEFAHNWLQVTFLSMFIMYCANQSRFYLKEIGRASCRERV